MPFALRRLFLLLALVLPAVLGTVAPTLAQPAQISAEEARNREEALELFNQGKIAYKAQDYDAALELFRRAQAKYDKEPLIILALAKTLDQAANQEKALLYYQLFLKVAPVTPAFAKDREATVARIKLVEEILRSRPGLLRFKGVPPGALVEIDGQPAAMDAQGEVKVQAGKHSARVSMGQRIPSEWPALQVAAGEVKVIEVVLAAPIDPSTLPHDHTWAWVAGGATVASLAVGAVFGVMAVQENDAFGKRFDSSSRPLPSTLAEYKDATGQTCSYGVKGGCPGAEAEGKRRIAAIESDQTWMIVGLGTGAGLAVVTTVLYLTAPVKEPASATPRTTWNLAPMPLQGGAGAMFALRY